MSILRQGRRCKQKERRIDDFCCKAKSVRDRPNRPRPCSWPGSRPILPGGESGLTSVSCGPTAHTPIIIHEIKRDRDGRPKHRFSWSCPKCGEWLPAYKAVTTAVVDSIAPAMENSSVSFLDRLSRAALSLAKEAADRGAIVVFEPSGKGADELVAEAVSLAHVVKYANQRLAGVEGLMGDGAATILEVQTLGERGLKYRHRFGRLPLDWTHLEAIQAPRLADTAAPATGRLLACSQRPE
jgi:hypothetical protein